MAYIQSTKITVAPAVKRSITKPEARLMSEKMLVSIINRLVDRTGFVITKTLVTTSPFEFNLFGYYFCIDQAQYLIDAIGTSASNIYAIIDINKGTHFDELIGQDAEGEYTGLTIQGTEPAKQDNQYYLRLLTKVDNVWQIPAESLIKFDESSLDVSVDGGEIK